MTEKLDFSDIQENPEPYNDSMDIVIRNILKEFAKESHKFSNEYEIRGMISYIVGIFSSAMVRIFIPLVCGENGEENKIDFFLQCVCQSFKRLYPRAKKDIEAYMNQQ